LIGENPDEKGSILWTDESYKHFEIELEYKTLTKDYDTGLFLRGESHQVQVGISRSLQKDMTGCIYAPVDELGSYPAQTDKVDQFHKVGEWNRLKVIVEGSRIQTFLNGQPLVDYKALYLPREGPIGLQLHSGVHMAVKFRNIQLKEIPMKEIDFSSFPSEEISNQEVTMKLFTPHVEKGMYRGTRFDWSGVIESVKFKGHEYFGYWKDTHDPTFHEDLAGPVEGYINPGIGYEEAAPGEGFIRIGVGVLEREDEEEYNWRKTYRVLDHGNWNIEKGEEWIAFTHEIKTDFGYGYIYSKRIELKGNGFVIRHELQNTGEKVIETDQFNHNFFMIDGERSGTAFKITFPFNISTEDDPLGLLKLEGNELTFLEDLDGNSVFVELDGYTEKVSQHRVTVENQKTRAGVIFEVDKPLARMVFWACETTLSPENSVWISLDPGAKDSWNSEYTLYVK
jgi:hypothetical protein